MTFSRTESQGAAAASAWMFAVHRVLLAPDKFKGSLTATEVAAALSRGILAARPDLAVRSLPVADGGEGTLDAAEAAGYERMPVRATGPTGEPVATAYARRGATAIVEMADVAGLSRLPAGTPQPLAATSQGVGEVIAAAVAAGCERIILGIGGSACTDGGAGMVQALGASLTDASGVELPSGGGALVSASALDLTGLRRLADIDLVVACDVDNPLTGAHGAAAVYGPQKGATPEDVARLDAGLSRWADLVAGSTGRDLRDEPGAGAAGGVGFGALAVLGARLQPGTSVLLELLDFQSAVGGVDVVVVGEGSLDEQSMHGKAPVGVAAAARAAGARVAAVCGRLAVDRERLRQLGIDPVYALSDQEPDPRRSMAEAAALLERVGGQLAAEV